MRPFITTSFDIIGVGRERNRVPFRRNNSAPADGRHFEKQQIEDGRFLSLILENLGFKCLQTEYRSKSATMASRKQEPNEEDANTPLDTRVYSDFILYFCKSGRFQHHPLLDSNRKRGVLNLLGAERVTKMTTERRLKPVVMTLIAGTPEQRVYLVAIVRESKSFFWPSWRLLPQQSLHVLLPCRCHS